MRLAALACAVGFLALSPDLAYACPVCFDRDDEARIAFLATTGLLTLLPLGMVGGFVMWIRKRARAIQRDSTSFRPAKKVGSSSGTGPIQLK